MFGNFPSFFQEYPLFNTFFRRKKAIRKSSRWCSRSFFLPKSWLNASVWHSIFFHTIRIKILNCSKQRYTTLSSGWLHKKEKMLSIFLGVRFFSRIPTSPLGVRDFPNFTTIRRKKSQSPNKPDNTFFFLGIPRSFWNPPDNKGGRTRRKTKKYLGVR